MKKTFTQTLALTHKRSEVAQRALPSPRTTGKDSRFPSRMQTSTSKVDQELIEASLARAVDEAISEMLGEAVVEAFYAHLQERRISRANLHDKLRSFCSALDVTFGIDSNAIQRGIARRLFASLGLTFSPVEGKGLVEYVQLAKEMMKHAPA